tara:strand:+ start:9606 stop:11048 length:1443 start_codon:yes stop_codon:yes gene_type:complete
MSIINFYNSLGFDGGTPDGSSDDAVNKSDSLYRIVESLPRNYKDPNSKASPFPPNYIDVKTQLPTWLVNINEPFDGFLINILQNYYDWLYDSDSGSGFYLDDKFATLKDNELVPQSLINLLISNYFPEANALMDVYVLSSQLNISNITLSEGSVLIDRKEYGVEAPDYNLIIAGTIENIKDEGIYSTPTQSVQKSILTINNILLPYISTRSGTSVNTSGDIVDINNATISNTNTAPTDNIVEVEILPLVSHQSARRFILNIINQFYGKKGTPESIAYFFNTLLDTESVNVKYEDISSYELSLNWKNYTVPKKYYEDFYLTYVHPVGTSYTLNQEVSTDFPSRPALGGGDSGGNSGDIPQFTAWEELTYGDGAYDSTGTGEEISILGNYFPYTLGDTGDIAATAGCSGATVSGITSGATGNTYTNMITYAFPDWSTAVEIAGSSFGLINIYEFAHLDAASGSTSPNDGRVANYSCPVGGYT